MGSNRSLSRLSALFVKRTTAPGRYADGGGLWLQIYGPTSKSWIFRYRLAGRERELGLGSAFDVSLVEAREAAAEARKLKAKGTDPVDAKREAKAKTKPPAETPTITFDKAAAAFVKTNTAGWKSAKHGSQWTNTLTTYASPIFGSRSVADIDRPAILRVIEPIWATKTETASRVRGRIEAVLDWATVMGFRTGENPARWKGNLDKVLPPRNKINKVQHHKAVSFDEVPAFLGKLQDQVGVASQALRFTILTAARTTEVRKSRWSEIDLEAKLWIIPASRMKGDKEHRVPLTEAAISALPSRGSAQGGDLVFPHQLNGTTLSENAMSAVLKRMGVDATVHGFRSSFSDWAAETTDYPREVVEMALAHKVANAVEAAYRRGNLLEKRKALMLDWASFCVTTSDVIDADQQAN